MSPSPTGSDEIPKNIPAYFKAETVKGYLNLETKEQTLRWTQYTVTSRNKFKESATEDVLDQPWSMVPFTKRTALINHVREAWPDEWDPNLANIVTEWRVSQLHNKARKSKPSAGRSSTSGSIERSPQDSQLVSDGEGSKASSVVSETKPSRYWDPIRDQDVEIPVTSSS